MLRTILTPASVLVALVVTLAVLDGRVRAFNVAEATIAQLEAELSSGRLTCQQVIQLHLNRIAAYDKAGPRLNAVIALNQQAIAQAQALDKSGRQGRQLFCIPVAIKDNIDQLGYPTAAGSVALNSTFPSSSALLLQKLLDAGAIVVARVNMAELAMDGMNTNSSLGGQTLNSYNRLVTPTGSSGGTGTAIAASFAVIGIGSDTNGSIQNPSSVQSLVGLRSTQGLISSIGVFPMLDWQDVAGPMTRTVEDLARTMDVIDAGSTWLRPAVPYSSMLDQKALRGVRIGFLQSTIVTSHSSTTNRTTVPSQEVVANCKRAMDEFAQLGASVTLVHPNVSFFQPYMMYNSIDPQALQCAFAEERSSWDYYFATRTTPSSPIKSTAQMVAAMQRNPAEIPSIVRKVSQINMLGKPNCTGIPALGCIKFHERNEQMARFLEWALEYYQVDALMYPPMNQPPPPLGTSSPGFATYSFLSAMSGMPAIVFQTGFTSDGLPLGMTLLSHSWSEARLIRYAYAYQSHFNYRRPPPSTPPLEA